jgi:hypothetical protein
MALTFSKVTLLDQDRDYALKLVREWAKRLDH